MRKIALIGCSKRKLNDGKKHFAKDMYLGNNFKKAKNKGVQKLNCEDHFYILSGNYDYGLLDQDDEINYYDVYLGNQKESQKILWAEKVLNQLNNKFGEDIKNICFVLFAGSSYTKHIKNKLNCVILKYNGRQITFDIKEELHNAI